jgi:hypothetical protein
MPISQGDEIRRLRKENERLKAVVRQANLPLPGDKRMSDKRTSPSRTYQSSPHNSISHHKLRSTERVDNLYFGSPSLATIVADVSAEHRIADYIHLC